MTSAGENIPQPIHQDSLPTSVEDPGTPIDPVQAVPEKKAQSPPSEFIKNRPSEQIRVEAVEPKTTVSENVSSRVAFEEKQIPLLSIFACQWVDVTNQVKVQLQIGKPLPNRHLRILTMLALGCENERETITLSFGHFFIRRIREDFALIGQSNVNNHNTESINFFDVFGSVLAHFPEQTTFFLNLYRKSQSVFLTNTKKFSENPWNLNEHAEDFYISGLEQLISQMDNPLSLLNLVETLKKDYSLLEVLYMIVVLNDLGMVEIRAKQSNSPIPQTLEMF
jgi:hypothetical protein